MSLKSAAPIATKRLNLRVFCNSDKDALRRLHNDPLVTRYAGGPRSPAASAATLEKMISRVEKQGFGPLAVELASTGSVIGWCGVQRMRQRDGYEVIFALAREHWGFGLATEAANSVMTASFNSTTTPMASIYALVYPQNLKSIAVLDRLGMKFLRHLYDDDTRNYACVYSVKREDFLNIH